MALLNVHKSTNLLKQVLSFNNKPEIKKKNNLGTVEQ